MQKKKNFSKRSPSDNLDFSPQLKSLSLPDCWIKDFFMAHMYTELQMIKEALQKYQNLIEAGFSKSTYIISQIAVAYHNIRGLFSTLLNPSQPVWRKIIPGGLTAVGLFSFQISTKLWRCSTSWGSRIHIASTTWTHSPTCSMSKWVHRLWCVRVTSEVVMIRNLSNPKSTENIFSCFVNDIECILRVWGQSWATWPTTWWRSTSTEWRRAASSVSIKPTCSGVSLRSTMKTPSSHFCLSSTGNYYSLRSQHEKAALYFQRALKLNPRCLGAWTLMGHEYMEMKNTSAAIQAYRSERRRSRACFYCDGHLSVLFNPLTFCDVHTSGMPLKWTSVITGPGMDWVKHTRSSRCLFTVCIIIERLTSSGRERKWCFMQPLLKTKSFIVIILWSLIGLWCIFVGLMTHACWSHWAKATKNCRSKWKPKRYETTVAE